MFQIMTNIKINFFFLIIIISCKANTEKCDVELDFGFENQKVNLCSLKKDLFCPIDEVFCYDILEYNSLITKNDILVLKDSVNDFYALKNYPSILLDTIDTKDNIVFGYNFNHNNINYILLYIAKSFYNRSTTRTDVKAYLIFNQNVIELPHIQNTISGKNISDFNKDGILDYVYLDELNNKVIFYSLDIAKNKFLLNDNYYINLEYLGGFYRTEENSNWFGFDNNHFLLSEKYICECM